MRAFSSVICIVALALGSAAAVAAKPDKDKDKSKANGKKAKEASACAVDLLPVVEGRSWTYRSLDDQLTLSIVKVTRGTPTSIEVSEKLGEHTRTETWTCDAAGLVVPPSSFLWAGEAGGAPGMDLAVTKREGISFPVAAAEEWVETLQGKVTRKDTSEQGAAYPDATVELERTVTPEAAEVIVLDNGSVKASKLILDVRGRAQVEDTRYEIAPRRQATLWYQPGEGIVRYSDSFDRDWDLVVEAPAAPPAPDPAP